MQNTTHKSNRLIATAALALGLSALSFTAMSHHQRSHADTYLVNARVTQVTPVYEWVTHHRPGKVCYRSHHTSHRHGQSALSGAVAGGIVGNIIGQNSEATLAGALIGSAIGHASAHNKAHHDRKCRYRPASVTKRKVHTGYEVSYRLHGRTFTTVMPDHPGKRIKIRVNLAPVS